MIMEGVLAGALKAFFKHALVQHKISFDEINAELKINDDDHEILGDEQEEKQEKVKDKNSLERE